MGISFHLTKDSRVQPGSRIKAREGFKVQAVRFGIWQDVSGIFALPQTAREYKRRQHYPETRVVKVSTIEEVIF